MLRGSLCGIIWEERMSSGRVADRKHPELVEGTRVNVSSSVKKEAWVAGPGSRTGYKRAGWVRWSRGLGMRHLLRSQGAMVVRSNRTGADRRDPIGRVVHCADWRGKVARHEEEGMGTV